MVKVLLTQLPVTPDGKPDAVAPVAPAVVSTIGVIGDETCTLLFSPAVIVLSGVT
jgi:hypothetical protein